MKPPESFMQDALVEARKAYDQHEVPVGAIVVKDGTIIGRGHNTKEQDNAVTGHAEINAMQEAAHHLNSWRLDGCTIYVTLEPCAMCAGAIMQSHIKTVYYGAKEPKYGAHVSTAHVFDSAPYPVDVFSGIHEGEAQALLQTFFQTIR